MSDDISMSSTLVIDGDWFAYSIAFSLENRSVEVFTDSVTEDGTEPALVGKFPTRTKFKASKHYNPALEYEIKDCQKSVANVDKSMVSRINWQISKLKSKTGCKHVIIALSGSSNFRDRLALPLKYKGNREGAIKPVNLHKVRDYLANTYTTQFAADEEADDILSKYQFKSFKNKDTERIVVCTVDKDARQTPGWLYNPNLDRLSYIQGLGHVELVTKVSTSGAKRYSIYGEGRKWLYVQLLMGDAVDHYNPTDICSCSKITALKAFKLLENLNTDKECWELLYATYAAWYPGLTSWKDFQDKTVKGDVVDLLQVYVDVAHMRRWDNDRLDVRALLRKYEII